MEPLEWQNSFNTGIEEIDNQHKQLLDFLKQLRAAKAHGNTEAAGSILEGLSEYTMSHFAFEESLMEESGYPYAKPHKTVHQTLIKRVVAFTERLQKGEDIYDELYSFLRRWLINHIQRDDKAYIKSVTAHFGTSTNADEVKEEPSKSGWMSRLAKKFFR